MATMFPPPKEEPCALADDVAHPQSDWTRNKEWISGEGAPAVSPLGTTMSASLMVGSMYCSKAGFTNLLYCLMTPSISRPRSVMSLRSRRTSRMSESVSTKIFIFRSCRGRNRCCNHFSCVVWLKNPSNKKKKALLQEAPCLQKT